LNNEGQEKQGADGGCSSEECGFTIFLDEQQIYSFMESGDYSSARELKHFNEVGLQLEKRVQEGAGLSVLALAVSENRISRDFAVLQIAHVLAKRGKKVLIVDCDFLQPGLSGLVENIEGLGFLDFLLYGSSLLTVAHSIGIDGVTVTGSGSFPVYKTMPFAKQEFGKVNEFLVRKSDVVIYCSTLHTDDEQVNPMAEFVKAVLLCCRIEEMEEGQLKNYLDSLKGFGVMVDVVCFSARGEAVQRAEAAAEEAAGAREEPAREPEKEHEPIYIEKMGEIDTGEEIEKGKLNLPRFITIAAVVIIASFIVWWVVTTRTIKERESSNRMTELVQKQRDAREAVEKQPADETVVDTTAAEPEELGREVEPQVEETKAERPVREAPAAGPRYAVHVASFRGIARAGSEVEYLEKQGYEVRVIEVEIRGVAWFRVLVGEYETADEARKARLELLALKRITYANVVKLKSDSTDGEK
jgi:cell division protein FtsN